LTFVVGGLPAFALFGWLNSFTAFLWMACGSLLAACLLLWRLGLWNRVHGVEPCLPWRAALRENWAYGRWLVASAVLHSISSQVQVFLTAGLLGLGAAGILRAMQVPSLLMSQVVTATGLLILPAFSAEFARGTVERMRYKAKLVSLALAGTALCFAVLLGFGARSVEYLLFGGRYSAYAWLMPLLALVPVASGLSMGYSTALRALQRPQFALAANVVAAPAAALAAFFFIRWWRLAGAAASTVLSYAILGSVAVFFYRRTDSRAAVAPSREPCPGGSAQQPPSALGIPGLEA
jgi:O-antigen/teichoic acid export membrane protein